ncbi:hypothetical protein CsSME_00036113 [Camellia sinensis var. sinensis]
MAKKKKIFGIPIPWLPATPGPRPPQLPTAETEIQIQTATTKPTHSPPSMVPGLSPTQARQAQASSRTESQSPLPSSATTQSQVTSQPESPSHAATQSEHASQPPSPAHAATEFRASTQPLSPSRVTPQPRATPQPSSLSHMASETQPSLQAAQPKSLPTLLPQPAVQTSSLPSLPSLTSTQAQLIEGAVTQPPLSPEKLQHTIQKDSQPPSSSTEPLLPLYQEEEQKPARSQIESQELHPKEEMTSENVLISHNHTPNQTTFHPKALVPAAVIDDEEEQKPARSQPESQELHTKEGQTSDNVLNSQNHAPGQTQMPKQPSDASPLVAVRDGEEEQNLARSEPESRANEERTPDNVFNSQNYAPNQTNTDPNGMPKQPSEASAPTVVRDGKEEQNSARSQPESQELHPKEERTSDNVLNSQNQEPSPTTIQPNGMPKPSAASVPLVARDGEEEQKAAKSQPESRELHPKEERKSDNVQTTIYPMPKVPSEASVPTAARDAEEEQKPAKSQPELQELHPKEERTSGNVLNSQNHAPGQTIIHPNGMPKQPSEASIPAALRDGEEEQKPTKYQPESQESQPKEERTSENVLNSQNHASSQMIIQPNEMPKQSSEASFTPAVAAPTSTATLETMGPTQKSDSSPVSPEPKTLQESDAKSEEIGESCNEPTISNGKRGPLLKEIRGDISKFVHKIATQHPKFPMEKKPVTVITLAGENRGASMQLGAESTEKEGAIHIHVGYMIKPYENTEVTSDGEEGSEDSSTEEDQAEKAYINGNVQGINNSILLHSSITEKNPGQSSQEH